MHVCPNNPSHLIRVRSYHGNRNSKLIRWRCVTGRNFPDLIPTTCSAVSTKKNVYCSAVRASRIVTPRAPNCGARYNAHSLSKPIQRGWIIGSALRCLYPDAPVWPVKKVYCSTVGICSRCSDNCIVSSVGMVVYTYSISKFIIICSIVSSELARLCPAVGGAAGSDFAYAWQL